MAVGTSAGSRGTGDRCWGQVLGTGDHPHLCFLKFYISSSLVLRTECPSAAAAHSWAPLFSPDPEGALGSGVCFQRRSSPHSSAPPEQLTHCWPVPVALFPGEVSRYKPKPEVWTAEYYGLGTFSLRKRKRILPRKAPTSYPESYALTYSCSCHCSADPARQERCQGRRARGWAGFPAAALPCRAPTSPAATEGCHSSPAPEGPAGAA